MSDFLDSKPFVPKKLEEERIKEDSKVYTIRLNKSERSDIAEAMKLLRQPKRGTTIKQLVKIGLSNVLHDEKTRAFLGIVSENSRKNERMGILDSTLENKQM